MGALKIIKDGWETEAIPQKVDRNAKKISFLSKILKPKSVIEIGTYTGYSALCIAEGLDPNGVIHTIDNNEELTYIQNKYLVDLIKSSTSNQQYQFGIFEIL